MASVDLEDIMFECPVCFGQIDDTWKMLSCQHTFCFGCLQKLYETNQNPQCPTCREAIAVSIEHLQRPRLLFSLYEKYRINRDEKFEAQKDELSVGIDQSMEEFRRNQDLYQENERLHIALCQSAEQAALEAEKESLLHAKEDDDLAVAQELSIQSNERELNSSKIEALELETALLESKRESLIQEMRSHSSFQFDKEQAKCLSNEVDVELDSVRSDDQEEDSNQSNLIVELTAMMQSCSFQSNSNQTESHPESSDGCSKPTFEQTPFIDTNDDIECIMIPADKSTVNEDCCAGVVENVETASSNACDFQINVKESDNRPFSLNVPNLSNYLSQSQEKEVLDAIVTETRDAEKLNVLGKSKISEYLIIINNHLDALKCYRRDQILKIVEDSGENREIVEFIFASDDWDGNPGTRTPIVDCDDDDNDLALAIELSRQMYIGTNDDVLFDVTLKKSQILDPIDALKIQFSKIKEKLEFRKMVIESEESI